MSLNNNPSKKTTPTNTTDSPYLGSKISLVSKAKIRYEGILYTIDANESTVALSKVRSFGTEDRPTDRPVPPRDEIFEYIIFRGADIEDLQVREPPQATLIQDPAIVESSASTIARPTNTNTNNNLASNQNRSSNQMNSASSSTQQNTNKGNKNSSNTDPLRQLNANQQSRTFNQQPVSLLDGHDFYGNQRRPGRQQQDYSNDFSNNSNNNNRRGNHKYPYTDWQRTNNSAWDNGYRQQTQRYSRQQQQQHQNYEANSGYPQRRPNTGGQQQNGYYGQRQRRNSTGGITGNQQNQSRQNRQPRKRADSIRGNSNGRSALKFIGDFDFEKSNAEFNKNAIEDELKKAISAKPNKENENPQANNDKETKDEQETQIQAAPQQPTTTAVANSEQEEQQPANTDGFYDKQKSFFDRISCETTEKEKTSNPRRNRNDERRLNAETFGLKYRPAQQGGIQRNGQGGFYNNNNRRKKNGSQSYYGNGGARYQRGGSAGNGNNNFSGGQQRGRNNTYYSNPGNRMQAF